MNWQRPRWMNRVRRLPEHLHELTGRFYDLANQVRDAVSELVGETVGNAVRDVIHRTWHPKPVESVRHREYDLDEDERGFRDRYRNDYDDEEEFRERSDDNASESVAGNAKASAAVPRSALMALGLQTVGWWLRKRGSWLGALSLGCMVSGLTLLSGPVALAGINLLEAASDLYSINQMLTTSFDTLN